VCSSHNHVWNISIDEFVLYKTENQSDEDSLWRLVNALVGEGPHWRTAGDSVARGCGAGMWQEVALVHSTSFLLPMPKVSDTAQTTACNNDGLE
jgi:hypothetical protein